MSNDLDSAWHFSYKRLYSSLSASNADRLSSTQPTAPTGDAVDPNIKYCVPIPTRLEIIKLYFNWPMLKKHLVCIPVSDNRSPVQSPEGAFISPDSALSARIYSEGRVRGARSQLSRIVSNTRRHATVFRPALKWQLAGFGGLGDRREPCEHPLACGCLLLALEFQSAWPHGLLGFGSDLPSGLALLTFRSSTSYRISKWVCLLSRVPVVCAFKGKPKGQPTFSGGVL